MPPRVDQPCPECGKPMQYGQHDDRVTYRGRQYTFKTVCWKCPNCAELILDGRVLETQYKLLNEVDWDDT